jgi:hypothetical protein
LIFGEFLTLQRKDTHGDKNHQPCTADLIFFIISVGAILQEKHILVMDLK